ncbi:MAG TPA: hypothetical protein VGC74_12830 [Stenotrophomonas sp.]
MSGSLKSDSHWTRQAGPYVVSGHLVVQDDAVLTIDAGTEIFMQPGSRLSVEQGGIDARGTADEPIRVRSSRSRDGGSAMPGDYGPWTFTAGTGASTKLEHVTFEHGQGLAVTGAAPVFNYVEVRYAQGAAISIDLAASPSGVGNRAEGNTLNAIVVPAGDIVDNVNWGLRGIPYLIQSGTLSVGRSPAVTSVTPKNVERGQTVSLSVDGVRLDGLSAVGSDNAGVVLTPIGASSATRASLQAKISAEAVLGAATLRMTVAAGELMLPVAFAVVQPTPAITAIAPDTVLAGADAAEIVVSGRNFSAESQVLVNAASLTTRMVSATELHADLPRQDQAGTLQLQVRTPDGVTPGRYLTSNSVSLVIEQPVPPAIGFEPTPIAMPPDSRPHEITLRLSRADNRDHTLNLSISDPAKATVSPTSLTLAAGQTTARVAITPLAQGSVALRVQSSTLGDASVPMFITPDFSGINTSHALPVGVFVEGEPTVGERYDGVVQGVVGVGVGSVLTGLSPSGWQAGNSLRLTVSGVAIPVGAQIAVVPETGIALSNVQVAADGRRAEVDVQLAGDVAVGPRRIVMRDANGSLLTFADASQAAVFVGAGLPRIESLTPMVMLRDSTASVTVRGRDLQNVRLELSPAEGVALDATPVVSDDGTELTASFHVDGNAALGDRVLRAANAVGTSAAVASSANTLRIVSGFEATYRWDAPLVGVTVGVPAPVVHEITPVPTQSVGVVVGASVTAVSPRAAIIGNTVQVTVRGQSLQAVTSVAMVPADGLVVGMPTINSDGSELIFSMQVAADAVANLRRLVLGTASGPMAFADANDGGFRVTMPVPELESISPYLLVRGGAAQTITVRGRYLDNASDVRVVPADGVTVIRPLTTNADGTELTLSLQAAASAAIGQRSLVVTTPAGDSSVAATVHNAVSVVAQLGGTLQDVPAPLVGVMVGEVENVAHDGTLAAPLVGVNVEEPPPPVETVDTNAVGDAVGVLVGAMATAQSADGWLQGASGVLRIAGVGLQAVQSVQAMPAEGLLFDSVSANADGSELSVGITVAQDAALGSRRLRLVTADGQVVWMPAQAARFGIGHVPNIDSITPIVLNAGTTIEMTVRGKDLATVTGIKLTPALGINLLAPPAWSQDASSEILKFSLMLDRDAITGSRVLQLIVPGGSTPATASPVNTFSVVPGQ